MSAPVVLEVDKVTKRFGGLVAVNNLEFKVMQHEVLGLIGPNGSGKTTMMNLISGAFKPTQGEIRLHGNAISTRPAREIARQGISRTFQLVRILPSLSVVENVVAGAAFGHKRLWGNAAHARALELLERVGLGHAINLPTSALTYIDQKRLELARALAAEPKILLLDEWLAGLNPTELKTGIKLIEGLAKEGRTVIIVEHVMDAIRSLCHRCVVMSSGSKIADGTPHEVLSDKEVIRAYLGDAANA
jgi:ABC-type branched-subunit amino acid transport system ATPase component